MGIIFRISDATVGKAWCNDLVGDVGGEVVNNDHLPMGIGPGQTGTKPILSFHQ